MKKTIFSFVALLFAATTFVACSGEKQTDDAQCEADTTAYDAYLVDVESADVDTVVTGNDTTIQAQTVDQMTPESVQQ